MNKRVDTYDVIRVILIILVVLGHAGYLVINFGSGGIAYRWPTDTSPIQNAFVFRHLRDGAAYLYLFHMPLFFALSGAVSFCSQRDYLSFKNLLHKKAVRLLVPYYACGLLFMLPIKWLTGGYTASSIGPATLNFLLGVSDNGHLWFLLALFWCFVVFYALYHLLYRRTGGMVWAVLAAWLIRQVFLYLPFNVLELGRAMVYVFWFALGVYFEFHRPRFEAVLKRFWPVLPVFLVGGGIVVYRDYQHAFLNQNVRIVLFWFLIYSFALLATEKTKIAQKRAYKAFVRHCMGVYLYHDPLEYVVLYFAFGYGWVTGAAGSVLYLLLRTVGVVAVSLLISKGVSLATGRVKRLLPALAGKGKM